MVLVVDDLADHVHTLSLVLESKGYEAHGAHRSDEALEKALTLKPSVILLDFSLPPMGGHQLARIIKGTPATARVPIVMQTAMREDEVRSSFGGFAMPYDAYIRKPFDIEQRPGDDRPPASAAAASDGRPLPV